MKPKISIEFNNGVIGAVTPLETGCFGLLASGVAVADGFELGKAYQLKSMKDVADLKITDSVDNHRLYKALAEFYAEAGEGSEIWLYGFSKETKVSDWFTPVDGVAPAEELLNSAKGKIRGLFTIYDPKTAPTVTEGMDSDVLIAAGKAQILFENYTAAKYAPFFTILEAYAFDGDKVALADLKTNSYNAVGILIGDTETRSGVTSSKGAAMGVFAGRLAAYPVRVNPGKVRNGSLNATDLFIVDSAVESFDTEALYDKGYITFTTHQSRAGYFVLDVPLASPVNDDYHYLTHRRIINEAYRLTYQSLLDYLLDEVPANPDGTIQAVYAKSIESTVVRAISTNMGDDLVQDFTDPNDLGVRAFVDPAQNIVTTSKLEVTVKIRPYGYNRWINVLLGFELTQ